MHFSGMSHGTKQLLSTLSTSWHETMYGTGLILTFPCISNMFSSEYMVIYDYRKQRYEEYVKQLLIF